MNFCYLIQTHKNPDQVYRLVRLIKRSNPRAEIIITHDAHAHELSIQPLQALDNIYLIQDKKPRFRGDFTLIKPYLDAIKVLKGRGSDFDWLIYLSGQDYPVSSILETENFFRETNYDGFLDFWSSFSDNNVWSRGKFWRRYFCQYRRYPEWTMPLIRQLRSLSKHRAKISSPRFRGLIPNIQFFLTYGPIVGIPASETPFTDAFLCYGGYQWHSLSRDCVLYIDDYIQKRPDLIQYYARTVVPDESLIQTILVNSGRFKLHNGSMRFADTDGREYGHARILTESDYDNLVSGNYHFARKFDSMIDPRILDKLDVFVAGV
jgi:hypothetical protein